MRFFVAALRLSDTLIYATVRCLRLACEKLLGLDLGTTDECTSEPVAYCFWHNQDQNLKTLPDVCLDGLRSAIHRGHFKVCLLSYQKLESVPEGVDLVTASDFSQASCTMGLFQHQRDCTISLRR